MSICSYFVPTIASFLSFIFVAMLVGLVFLVFKSLLGFARQWSREKFTIWTLKPRSHVKNFNISNGLFFTAIR